MSNCYYRHHLWVRVGPAPAFRELPCVLWCCERCGKEWELFEDATPGTGTVKEVEDATDPVPLSLAARDHLASEKPPRLTFDRADALEETRGTG